MCRRLSIHSRHRATFLADQHFILRCAAQSADPDWKVYLEENVKAGYIVNQRTSLMTPVKFCPPLKRK